VAVMIQVPLIVCGAGTTFQLFGYIALYKIVTCIYAHRPAYQLSYVSVFRWLYIMFKGLWMLYIVSCYG